MIYIHHSTSPHDRPVPQKGEGSPNRGVTALDFNRTIHAVIRGACKYFQEPCTSYFSLPQLLFIYFSSRLLDHTPAVHRVDIMILLYVDCLFHSLLSLPAVSLATKKGDHWRHFEKRRGENLNLITYYFAWSTKRNYFELFYFTFCRMISYVYVHLCVGIAATGGSVLFCVWPHTSKSTARFPPSVSCVTAAHTTAVCLNMECVTATMFEISC